jgi:hypothetical protein
MVAWSRRRGVPPARAWSGVSGRGAVRRWSGLVLAARAG